MSRPETVLLLDISPDAVADLDEIWSFVSRNSQAAARQLIDVITARFDLLTTMPQAGRERSELYPNLRSFPIGRYVIFYRVVVDVVEIVRVLHGARDVESIFNENH